MFQPDHALGHVLDLVQIIQPRGLPSRLRVVDLLDPRHVRQRPRLHPWRRTLAGAQQELTQPVTRPHLILLSRLARSHQIAQRLGTFVRNPHWRQIAGPVAARQPLGIAPIRLHPVASLTRRRSAYPSAVPPSGPTAHTGSLPPSRSASRRSVFPRSPALTGISVG